MTTKKSKDPAFLFYANDFMSKTYFMTNEQVGMYIRALSMMFTHGGKLTEKQLRHITSDEDVLAKFKRDEEGLFYNRRLLEEMENRRKLAEKNRANALKGGGNPNFKKGQRNIYYPLKDNPKDKRSDIPKDKRKDNQKINITLEDEDINVNDNKDLNINEIKDKEIIADYVYFQNAKVNELFMEFLDLRKELKAKNTDRAITLLVNKLNPHEDSTKIKMIENAIMNSWKSVYELNGAKGKEKPKAWKEFLADE